MSPMTQHDETATIHMPSEEWEEWKNNLSTRHLESPFSGPCGKYSTRLRRTLGVAPIPFADELEKFVPSVIVARFADAWGKLPLQFASLWEYVPIIFAEVWGRIPVKVAKIWRRFPILLEEVWARLPSWFTKEWEHFPARFAETWNKFPAIFAAVWLGRNPELSCVMSQRLQQVIPNSAF